MGEDPELSKTINALRARVGFSFELTDNPVEDPDLVAKYPEIKGPNKNLIREIRRERRVELFAKVIVGTTFVVGMPARYSTIVNVEVLEWIPISTQPMKLS